MAKKRKKNWVRSVKTVSTYPPKDLFTKDAQTIARAMASKKVSPKGIGSGIRMIQYFINRAGTDFRQRASASWKRPSVSCRRRSPRRNKVTVGDGSAVSARFYVGGGE